MASSKVTECDTTQLLDSQQLLDESILCISNGMELEDNNELDSALIVYQRGVTLLQKASDIETNNDVLPIIAENLDSIQQRIDSIRSRLQFDSMVSNLRQMQQRSIDLFNEYNSLSEQHSSLYGQYDQVMNQIQNDLTDTHDHSPDEQQQDEDDNNNNKHNDDWQLDADQLLNNLYQQYYGTNYVQHGIETVSAVNNDSNSEQETDAAESEQKTSQNNQTCTSDPSQLKFEEPLVKGIPNDICGYILEFISGRDLTTLFTINKYWFYSLLYDATFCHLWKRVIIGADPIRNSLGHNLNLKWIKSKQCGTVIRSHIETLIISTAGLALDSLLKNTSDDELYILRQCKLPRLKTLVFYGWSNMSTMSLKMVLKHNLTDLTELYLETPVDVLDVLLPCKSLRVLSCNVVNCNDLQLTETHKFKNLIFLSFVFGVDDFVLNRIFFSFPNLVHIGLEFDEMASSLSKLLLYKTNAFKVLHMSWNKKTFWGLTKNRGQVDVEYWLKELRNVKCIVLDRDYVFDDDDKIKNVEAIGVLRTLLPHITIRIAGGECTYNLSTFTRFCGLQ